jgi:hypothetical protein
VVAVAVLAPVLEVAVVELAVAVVAGIILVCTCRWCLKTAEALPKPSPSSAARSLLLLCCYTE